MALGSSANPASGVVEGMGIGSSSIWVLAVVTSSASLAMTHEEADYYRVYERIEGPSAREFSPTLIKSLLAVSTALPGAQNRVFGWQNPGRP